MDDGRIVFRIDGDDSGLQRTLNNSRTSFEGLKSVIVKLGLGALITKTFTSAVKATNEFGVSLAKASTLFGDVAVNTDKLSEKILELSSATGQSAESISDSLYSALSAGVEVTEDMGTAMEFLESATKLSVAGFTDVDTAVTATAKVINAYGMSISEASRVGEILMETQNLGITTVNELGSALATVTPVAASFGVSFEQVGASLAVMTKQGTDTATATTQLRAIISELGQDGQTASKNLLKAFSAAGLEYRNFAEYINDNHTLTDAISLLEEQASSTGLSLSDMFGNVRAGIGALQLAGDEAGVFDTFLQDLQTDTNLVEEAYDRMMSSRTNSWNKMRQQLKNITISITNSDAVQSILDGLTDKAQVLIDRIESFVPALTEAMTVFKYKAELIFASLDNIYNNSFLGRGIKFSVELVRNELQEILDRFSSGDLLGAGLEIAGDLLMVKIGLSLVKTGVGSLSAMTGAITGAFAGLGFAALTADALMVAARISWAMNGGDWQSFAGELLVALTAGVFAGIVTANPAVGALVFGVMFKFLGWVDNNSKTLPEEIAGTANEDPSQSSGILINKLHIPKRDKQELEETVQTVGELADEFSFLQETLNDVGMTFQARIRSIREFSEIGAYILEGLGVGMEDDIDSFTDNYCLALISGLRNSLEIHSPSKVAERDVGRWVGLGIAEGLWNTDTEEAIDDSVNNIMDRIIQGVKTGEFSLKDSWDAPSELLTAGSLAKSLIAPVASTTGDLDSVTEAMQAVAMVDERTLSGWDRLKLDAKEFFSFFDLTTGMSEVIDDEVVLTEKGQFWLDTMNSGLTTLLSGFEALGQNLAEGEASWGDFAKAGLEAIASILESLGYELAAMAVETYPNFAQMALSAAASAMAFTGAGIVRGFAGNFETGGIVGGSGYTGDRHMIFANAGELILSRAQQASIASQLGGSGRSGGTVTIEFNGQVFGDKATISEYVYDGIMTAQNEGRIARW